MLAALTLVPTGAQADVLACQVRSDDAQMRVQFDVTPQHFFAMRVPGEPPRRAVSTVQIKSETFQADAILTQAGWRGFWDGSRDMLMTVAPDGAATLTHKTAVWRGTCEEIH